MTAAAMASAAMPTVTITQRTDGRYDVDVQQTFEPWAVLDQYEAVHDEYGHLQRVGFLDAVPSTSGGDYHDFCDPGQAQAEYLENRYPRPPAAGTVRAEIVIDDADWVAQTVRVSGDPRLCVPMYRVAVAGEEPLIVTRAQLAALVLAAEQILGAATPAAAA